MLLCVSESESRLWLLCSFCISLLQDKRLEGASDVGVDGRLESSDERLEISCSCIVLWKRRVVFIIHAQKQLVNKSANKEQTF